ncbi:hypothetical protein [Salinigranum salinum]|uniref:hypothetical protein n=1 Tax=Salinigranum salinum TaxID=1364937 RepID=UPI0012605E2F|nr:hypothetical protein [Salinigranum salinum]
MRDPRSVLTTLASRRQGCPPLCWLLIGLLGFLGVRGVLGGGQFVLVPSGELIGLSTGLLASTPLDDFFLPGVVLLIGLGVVPLAAAYGLYRGEAWAWLVVVAVGVGLLVWVFVEGIVVGFGERLQVLNAVQALVMLLLAAHPTVREHCTRTRLSDTDRTG